MCPYSNDPEYLCHQWGFDIDSSDIKLSLGNECLKYTMFSLVVDNIKCTRENACSNPVDCKIKKILFYQTS